MIEINSVVALKYIQLLYSAGYIVFGVYKIGFSFLFVKIEGHTVPLFWDRNKNASLQANPVNDFFLLIFFLLARILMDKIVWYFRESKIVPRVEAFLDELFFSRQRLALFRHRLGNRDSDKDIPREKIIEKSIFLDVQTHGMVKFCLLPFLTPISIHLSCDLYYFFSLFVTWLKFKFCHFTKS